MVVISTMIVALNAWLDVLGASASATVTVVFVDTASERLQQARVIFAASSDAAGDGVGTPGIGGFIHGFYWRVAIPLSLLGVLHITAWETVAACLGVLIAARLAGNEALVAMQVDALLTPFAISGQRSRSVDIQDIIQRLLRLPNYREDVAKRLILRHLSGTSNAPSDYSSRGLWDELAQLCDIMRIKPVLVRLNSTEIAFLEAVVEAAASRRNLPCNIEELRQGLLTEVPVRMQGRMHEAYTRISGEEHTAFVREASADRKRRAEEGGGHRQ